MSLPTGEVPSLDKDKYLDAFHADASALVEAARRGLDAPVPSCPGWTVGALLGHIGGVYVMIAKNVSRGKGKDIVNELEDLELAPEYEEWFRRQYVPDIMPTDIVDWVAGAAANLERTLRAADPREPAWTWWEQDQTAGFWMRRMAQETAVHRWDAQLAHGEPEPIESELACDGIDEVFDIMLPMRREWVEPQPSASESYHFHRTDGPGEWLVRFPTDGPGEPVVTREHAKADVAIRGPASDLLLFLWQRVPAERMDVIGDVSLVDRFFELVPPD